MACCPMSAGVSVYTPGLCFGLVSAEMHCQSCLQILQRGYCAEKEEGRLLWMCSSLLTGPRASPTPDLHPTRAAQEAASSVSVSSLHFCSSPLPTAGGSRVFCKGLDGDFVSSPLSLPAATEAPTQKPKPGFNSVQVHQSRQPRAPE